MIDVCTVQEKGDVHRFPFGTGNTWYPCHKMSRRSRSPQGSSGLYFLRTGYNIQSVIRQLSGTQGSLHCYARVRQRRKKRWEKMFLRGYTSTKYCWNACFFASAVSGFNIFKIFSPFTLLSAIYPFDHLSTFRIPNLDIPRVLCIPAMYRVGDHHDIRADQVRLYYSTNLSPEEVSVLCILY